MGRPKQPQQLLELKGTARKARRRIEAMVGMKITNFDQVAALCDYTHLTEQGQRIFIRQCTFLIGMNALQAQDLEMLMLYAQNYDIALRCMDQINSGQGWFNVTKNKRGEIVAVHELPYLKLFRRVSAIANSIGGQFGFTPISRIRMAETAQPDKKKADIMDISSDAIEI